MRIQKGDNVKVLYGSYAGQTGTILRIIPKKNMVIVEGINKVKKHVKGDGQSKESAIVEIVKPMPVAKVQLIGADGKPTRVRYEGVKGDKKRVSVKSGKAIDTVSVKKETKKKEVKKAAPAKKKATKKVAKKSTKKESKKK